MNGMKNETPAIPADGSQISSRLRERGATLNMMPSILQVLKPWLERILKRTLAVEVGRLQAGLNFKELFRRLLDSMKGLRSATEFVLPCGTDFCPMDGCDPVLRFGGIRLDASNDRVRNFPGEVGVPFLGKKHYVSGPELMGLHGAFLPRRARAGRNARTRSHLCGRCEGPGSCMRPERMPVARRCRMASLEETSMFRGFDLSRAKKEDRDKFRRRS